MNLLTNFNLTMYVYQATQKKRNEKVMANVCLKKKL